MITMRQAITTILICFFCLAQLSGCGGGHHKYAGPDGAPSACDMDPAKIRNAVPKSEPYHPYGRKNYVVGGKRYRVLKSSKGYAKRGYASWYGTKFHGKETSTQERFNMYGMTAASRELPLPSYVHVTNLRNGKKVIVKVNDRGPFVQERKRILDLSYAAAKKLGFVEHGVAPVKIVAIDPKTWNKKKARKPVRKNVVVAKKKDEEPKKLVQNKIFLQVGAFAKLDNAKQLSDEVTKITENPVHIEHKADLYRVHVGPLASSSQSDELKILLEKSGFEQVALVDG